MNAPLPSALRELTADMLVEAIIDGLAYRLALVECIDQLRQVTIERDRARAECIRLREAARR